MAEFCKIKSKRHRMSAAIWLPWAVLIVIMWKLFCLDEFCSESRCWEALTSSAGRCWAVVRWKKQVLNYQQQTSHKKNTREVQYETLGLKCFFHILSKRERKSKKSRDNSGLMWMPRSSSTVHSDEKCLIQFFQQVHTTIYMYVS